MQLLKLMGDITLQDLEEKHPNIQPGKGEAALLLLLCIYIAVVSIYNLYIFHADDFRSGCIKKIRRIYTDLLAQSGARNLRVIQQEPKTQFSNELQSNQHVALCRLHLLEELMELQEGQASALMHKVRQPQCSAKTSHTNNFSVVVH